MNKSGITVLGVLSILMLVVAVSGCTGGSKQYNDKRLSFSYPENWNITDKSNTTDTLVVFDATELLRGEVDSYTLQPGETVEKYTSGFDAPQTINGYTHYFKFSTDPNNSNLVYYDGIFVKDGVLYTLRLYGNTAYGDIDGAYENITQSFKIK
jgi:hypothetical protein